MLPVPVYPSMNDPVDPVSPIWVETWKITLSEIRAIEIDTYRGCGNIRGRWVVGLLCRGGVLVGIPVGSEVVFSSRGYFVMTRPDFLWKSMCFGGTIDMLLFGAGVTTDMLYDGS